MTARIRWEPGQYANLVGYVGTLEPWAFQIWHIIDAGHWSLITSLPEHQTPISTSADPEKLKGRAEDWLEGFTASLGAVFPAELRETLRSLRCVQAGWAFGVPEDGREQWLDLVTAAMAPSPAPETAPRAEGD